MTPTRTTHWLGAVLGAGLLAAAGCTASGTAPPPVGELRLVSFDSCEDAAEQLRTAATAMVQPWGLSGAVGADLGTAAESADGMEAARNLAGPDPAAAPNPGAAPDTAARQAPGGVTTPGHSGTNVHEAGVDEPDLIKTDGRRIVTVSNGTLRVVDAQRRVQTGTLLLDETAPVGIWDGGWQPADLLLHGDRALVLLDSHWWGMPMPEGGVAEPGRPMTDLDTETTPTDPELLPAPIVGPRLLLVDLSTGDPRLVSEYTVDGSLVDARAIGQTARVVVRSAPRLSFPVPDASSSPEQQLMANRAAIADAEVTDWLPRFQVSTGGRIGTGQVDCTSLRRPEQFSGMSMLTVLTFDLSAPALDDGAPVGVVADGDTVYSNGSSLYVASDQRWRIQFGPDGGPVDRVDERTELYKFDISQAGPPRYVAAGAVPGWLVNQYALSEWEEHLRVATTTGQAWGEEADSESAVYVLAERDGELVQVGSVGGLGKSERIYSVRYAGSVGYVVTFRETDPLYTLDLIDPADPTVLGELKITGYSAYLHPIDADRVIGVGQEADRQGRTQGTQISLFDVSDLAEPVRLAQHHVAYGHSEAEFDPHAFLWWPAERLLVIPLTVADWSANRSGPPESGVLLLRFDDGEISELATISHPRPAGREFTGQIRRSLVVGSTLWTVSDLGLQANDLSTFEGVGWVPFR